MIVAVVLAAAYASDVDIRRLVVLAGAIYLPWLAAAAIAWIVWKARPEEDNRPSLFCEGVAAELRAGSALRDALATAATSVGCKSEICDHPHNFPMTEVAAQLADEFPAIADELRLTVLSASRSGSQAADLFDEIGALAIAQAEIRREVRVATAPGRATALLLVGAPTFYLLGQGGSGGLDRMLASPQQRVVAAIGLGLFLVGSAAAWLVVWKAGR